MNSRIISLNNLPTNQKEITPVFTIPFGEPIAFEFRTTIILIRSENTSFIIVKDVF